LSLPYKATLFLIVILANSSQCRENWDMKYIVERGGLVYAPNSDKPYTGKVHKNDHNGDPLVTGAYKTGRKHGNWMISSSDNSGANTEETFDLGRLIRRASYIFDSSGQPSLNGEFNEWYLNGNKKQETIFLLGDKHGKEKLYYESGGIKSQGEYTGNEKHGYWTNYVEDGSKDNSGPFQHSERSGIWVWFYPNGKVQSEYIYTYGKVNGLSKAWSETGQLLLEREWVNGHEHGSYKRWNQNGEKECEGEMTYSEQFDESFKTGQWKRWYKNVLYETGNYSIGMKQPGETVSLKIGTWHSYDMITGDINWVEEYDSLGRAHGKHRMYNTWSSSSSFLFRVEEYFEGECIEIQGFDSSGTLTYKSEAVLSSLLQGNYEGSTPSYQVAGACITYFSDGTVRSYGNLDQYGFRTGKWTFPNATTPLKGCKYYISPWAHHSNNKITINRTDSIYTEVFEDGQISAQGKYSTSVDRNWFPVKELGFVRDGKWTIWNEKLGKTLEYTYDNGFPVIDF